MKREYVIYSKKIALELREQGFELVGTGVNKNFPQYDTYIFKNSKELQEALTKLSK